jgi:hypothetical protein
MKKSIRILLLCVAFILFFLQERIVMSEVRFYSVEEPAQEDDKGEYDEHGEKNEKGENEEKVEEVFDDNSVIFPNGGEILLIGNAYNIRWNFDTSIQSVSVYFSTDSGLTWEIIVEDTTNDGAFWWIVPPIPSGDCLVKVKHAEEWEPSDISNGGFALSANPDKWQETDGP